MNNPPICKAPWVSLTLAAEGSIKPCCVWSRTSDEHISGSIHRGDTLQSAWDSLEPLRKQFLNQEMPVNCTSCKKRDATLGSSRKDWYEEKIKFVPKTWELNPPLDLRHMDLNFGNTCNLKCRMCGSWGSTAWFKEDRKLMKINPAFRRSSTYVTSPTIVPASYWENSRDVFKNLERIDFKGGEPMMQEGMYEFLEYMIEWGLARNISVAYTTNGTHRPERLKELLPYFKEVRMMISVEAVGDLYSYIRGGNVQNIQEVEESVHWFNQFTNLVGGFNSAIQIYNVFHLKELYEWFARISMENPRWKVPYMDCLVSEPKYLDINIMPDYIKAIAYDRIKDLEPKYFDNMKKSLQVKSHDPKLWELFKQYTVELDKMRETNVLEVLPELKGEFHG